MYTIPTFSKKSRIDDCVSLKAYPQKQTSGNARIATGARKLNQPGEKAIVVDMFNRKESKYQPDNFTYIIKPGDNKRMNKKGVLTMYNRNEPLNIPIEELLGKWKNTHIGAKLVFNDGEWCAAEGFKENSVFDHEPGVRLSFQKLMKFVAP